MSSKSLHCPGGVCEIKRKEPIQTFNTIQKTIAIASFIAVVYGGYAYMYKLDNKTGIAKKVAEMMISQKELDAMEELKYQQELSDFEDDDF